MADRFDIEDKIMRASVILDDIDCLRDALARRDMSPDELDNYLLGMHSIYMAKFDDLEDTVCQVFKLNNYRE
jgi:hypothetical protein